MEDKYDILKSLKIAAGFVVVMWSVFLFNILFPFFDFNRLGILPRTPSGLIGIITSPFLHGSILHIISNTFPLFVLMILLLIFYKKLALNVLIILYILPGVLVWCLATNGYHIGASGLIYALAGFLCALGFFRQDLKSILISVLVIILYGGLVWGVLPVRRHISWESHLFGAAVGIITAYISRNVGYEKKEKVK